MGLISEFKKFVMRGNVIDMAVGIIIGGAFGTIISSLVNDVIMPPIGLLIGGVDFSELAIIIKQAATSDGADVAIRYGAFLNTVITFLIIAFAIFMVIKGINKLERSKKQPEPEKAPEPTTEEKLLAEIRDLLKKK